MAKWKNKGHEFDELGNYFKQNNSLYIVGSNIESLNKIAEKLKFLKNAKPKILLYNSLLYKLLNKFGRRLLFPKSVVIVPNEDSFIYNVLIKKGYYSENKNIFLESAFFNKYLSIYAVYVSDKVYFPSNSFICTTVCTLNCKDCLNFAPYDQNKQHFDIKCLKQDVDTYFRCVDRVGLFHISGGEPFSYPHLAELITYINKNYKDKIDILGTVTNMTIVPSDELCEVLKKCDVRVELDDYTETNPTRKEQFEKVFKKIKDFGIITQVNVACFRWHWVSVLPSKELITDEHSLIKKYDYCGSVFQELKNGKLFGCCYCEFIAQAGCMQYKCDDYYDLTSFDKDKKKELVEFRNKYNQKGYVEFCKYCNGLPPYNENYVQPAVQAKGQISWDINNPTTITEINKPSINHITETHTE